MNTDVPSSFLLLLTITIKSRGTHAICEREDLKDNSCQISKVFLISVIHINYLVGN